MLLMLLGALAIAWVAVIVVMVALCVNAARSDRATAGADRVRAARPQLRLIA
jgi:hypothetical protein